MRTEALIDAGPTGIVLAGGGARGAYEAGVVSVLLPELERRGERPTLMVGTSVGAINTAFLGCDQHLDAQAAVEVMIAHWREVTKHRVLRPLVGRHLPVTALRYAAEILSVPGVRVSGLLDPTPLARSLDGWLDFDSLHRNVSEGIVDSVAVIATAARSGRSVAFREGAEPSAAHRSHVIDYVDTRIASEHVRASAAIPIAFPPVRVEAPREARGWYVDGGTRLNTPIKPALDLGAKRLVVVATDSIDEPSEESGRYECDPPDFGDGALHLLNGALVDPLIEDLRMLGNVNAFFTERAPGAKRYRDARGKHPYRVVPYLFVGPQRRGAIGALATEVFRSRYGGLKGLRSPDFPLLRRLIGGDGPAHGELLSYLFFDPEFIEELILMGIRDARRCVASAAEGDLWRTEPLDTFLTVS